MKVLRKKAKPYTKRLSKNKSENKIGLHDLYAALRGALRSRGMFPKEGDDTYVVSCLRTFLEDNAIPYVEHMVFRNGRYRKETR